jgi:hypothetical protein
MLSMMAVLGPHEFGLRIWLWAQGGSQISAGRKDFEGGSTVLSTVSKGLEIKLSDFEAENTMLKGDYLGHLVEIVIAGVPPSHEVCFMCLFTSLSRIRLQDSVSTNLFDPVRHQVQLQIVEVGIKFLGNIYLMADIIIPGVYSTPRLVRCPSVGICFLIYLSFLHDLSSQGIGFGLRVLAGSPE